MPLTIPISSFVAYLGLVSQFLELEKPTSSIQLLTMKFLPFALLGLAMSTSAIPEAATPSASDTPSATTSGVAASATSKNPVEDFVECLWPVSDRVVQEIKGLGDLSFNKLIDEVHWEIIWWGDPSKWVPDLVGIGLNATFVAACLLEVTGYGLAYSTTDVFNEFLKTFDLIPKNASNTDVPGLR